MERGATSNPPVTSEKRWDGRRPQQTATAPFLPPTTQRKKKSRRVVEKLRSSQQVWGSPPWSGGETWSRAQTPPSSKYQREESASLWMTGDEKVTAEATLHSKPQNKQANKLCEFHLKVTDDLSCLSSSTFAQGYTRSRLTSPVECLSVVQSFSFLLNSSQYIQSFFGVFCTLFWKTTTAAKFTMYSLFV